MLRKIAVGLVIIMVAILALASQKQKFDGERQALKSEISALQGQLGSCKKDRQVLQEQVDTLLRRQMSEGGVPLKDLFIIKNK